MYGTKLAATGGAASFSGAAMGGAWVVLAAVSLVLAFAAVARIVPRHQV